jgi:predicted acylesterase/phospholipase RssA
MSILKKSSHTEDIPDKLPDHFLKDFPEHLSMQSKPHTESSPRQIFRQRNRVYFVDDPPIVDDQEKSSEEKEYEYETSSTHEDQTIETLKETIEDYVPEIDDNSNHEINYIEEDRWLPDVIVMGPGGMKGFLHLGCLIPFHEMDFLKEVKIMIGVSVGSIILLLYLIGYSIDDIIQEGLNIDVQKDFADFNIQNIKERGFFSMNKLTEKISIIVKRKFGFIPTLLQLYKFTGIHFMVITTKLPGSEVRIDHISDPNLSCIRAVLFSSTIPFVFTPSEYKGMILYDGALTNPYPTNIFDDGKHRILGLFITADEHVEEGLIWLFNTVARIPMKQLRIVNQDNASENVKHIELTSPTMDFTGVSSDMDEKNGMIRSGFLKAVDLLNELGYDTTHLDVNKHLEITYVNSPDNSDENVEEIDYSDPERYLTIEVSPHLHDHVSSDQLGYFDPIPDIDFGQLDPEVIDNNESDFQEEEKKEDIKKDINVQILELIASVQKYVDTKKK